MSKWIWLDTSAFPEYNENDGRYCRVELACEYLIPKGEKYKIRACADARYELFVNGKFIGRGPVSAGGDFLYPKMINAYYDTYELKSNEIVEIRAIVTSKPLALCEYSFGKSGFYLEVIGKNGAPIPPATRWRARPLSECVEPTVTDYTCAPLEFAPCKEIEDIYNALPSPISRLEEKIISPVKMDKIDLNSTTGRAVFDKIYSAYPLISIKADGEVRVNIKCEEIDGVGEYSEVVVVSGDTFHACHRLRSVGQITLTLENISAKSARIDSVKIIYSAYPVKNEATFACDDELLNEIYELSMHTLKICRRDIHLDSPHHQEFLACTGDYFIQALMEYYNICDPSLTRFDILRTAKMFEIQDGRIFHTTYSLIFAEWLLDYYMHTADLFLVKECRVALERLFGRFDTYMGENGLIEKAPNYMFVDWILMDENGNHTDPTNMMSHGNFEGFSLHHPPKALGQSVLCMFYYNALNKGKELFELLGDSKSANMCLKKAQNLKNSINAHLYDSERGLYLGGLNTEDMVEPSEWLPKNTKNRFYLKQANTLAVLYGIAPEDKARDILTYVITDLKKEEMQPYFYHFLFEALIKMNMFDPYGMELLRRYESLLKKCDKGLCEAWEMFPSDCSHAWGGTPAYILKKALSGFEILEAGFKRVKIRPWIFDLDYIYIGIPTPYGEIEIRINENGFLCNAPDEIQVVTEEYKK